MSKYLIINAEAIQQRIEELEKEYNQEPEEHMKDWFLGQIEALKQTLAQSTPLIPEIEKAFEQGQNSVEAVMKCEEFGDMDWYAAKKITQTKQNYIANLKLDI